MPWILCGPALPSVRSGESFGSTATICTPGTRSLRTWPTPVMVPPVPTPATNTSTWPSVSRRISSAVVFRWIAAFAGVSNWWARIAPGVSATICSARETAPFMPSGPGVRTISAPNARISARRSTLIVSGIVMTTRYPRAAPTRASAMPVLPDDPSTMVPPACSSPDSSAASMIATPRRSFTLDPGL